MQTTHTNQLPKRERVPPKTVEAQEESTRENIRCAGTHRFATQAVNLQETTLAVVSQQSRHSSAKS